MTKATINIYSDFNFVTLGFIEHLLSINFVVNLFCSDKNVWNPYLELIRNNKDLHVLDKKLFSDISDKKYILYTQSFCPNANSYDDFISLYKKENLGDSKVIAVFSKSFYEQNQIDVRTVNDTVSLVLLNDLFSPRAGENLSYFQSLIYKAFSSGTYKYNLGEVYYPVFIMDAVREISKWIFSFGKYGVATLILGKPTSTTDLENKLLRVNPNLKSEVASTNVSNKLPRGVEIVNVNSNLESMLEFYKIRRTQTKSQKDHFKKAAARPTFKFGKELRLASRILLIIYLFIPMLVTTIMTILIGISYVLFKTERLQSSRNVLIFNKTIGNVAATYSNILSYTPGVGVLYKETAAIFMTTGKLSEIYYYAIPVLEEVKDLGDKVFGDQVYDPQNHLSIISTNLEVVKKLLGLYVKETQSKNYNKSVFIQHIMNKYYDRDYLSIIGNVQKILNNGSNLLGKEVKRTYLVLFQNNMELRPTGGFIGSFGLVSFEGGRMTDFSVSDVYSADGQLKGHVEPPGPIKDYLGEANWYLRDSNWSSDFTTSAIRAQWFLEKEIDKKVDGVIGVDLFVVKELLRGIGAIDLPDYDLKITADNIYEKTQEEVHKEFFPGSTKKASFLTALSKNLVTEITESSNTDHFIKSILSSLDKKHIQISINDQAIQNVFNDLNVGGGYYVASCGDGCLNDTASVIEANLGVNKANYFVTREFEINVNLDSERIEREMYVTIKNSAPQQLGTSAIYKPYVRFAIDKNSKVDGVWDVTNDRGEPTEFEVETEGDRQEVGFFTQVVNGESKKFAIKWTKNLSSPLKSYNLYVRKQAGIDDNSPVRVNYSSPLTSQGSYTYNTALERDLLIKLPLK